MGLLLPKQPTEDSHEYLPVLPNYRLYGFRIKPFVRQICRITHIGYYTIERGFSRGKTAGKCAI